MGAAVDLLDAVVAKLNETSFGTATVQRKLLPEPALTELTVPLITVTFTGKEKFEVDRRNDHNRFEVGVGYHCPTTSTVTLETALGVAEDIQDWLSDRDNRKLTTASGVFSLLPPTMMEVPFDAVLAKEAALFYTVIKLSYIHTQDRS